MKKIFIISFDIESDCAELRVYSYNKMASNKCSDCGLEKRNPSYKPKNLIVEWLAGSDFVCHFIYCLQIAGGKFIREEVKSSLSLFKGIEYLDFSMRQDPKLKPAMRVTKRTKKRVWLPYQGPPIHLMWVYHWVKADLARSSYRIEKECPACGLIIYEFDGIEKIALENPPYVLEWARFPREKGKGVYIRESDLKGNDFFRVVEMPGAVFCTERVKEVIESERFKNVVLLEAGELI